MADDAPDEVCLLCDKPITQGTSCTTNNVKNFVEASKKRQDGRYLKFKRRKNMTIHLNCKKSYTVDSKIESHLRRLQKLKNSQPQAASSHEHATRSTRNVEFDFENLCYICGNDASDSFVEAQRRYSVDRRSIVRKVTSNDVRKKAIEKCYSVKTQLTTEVLSRIECVDDLVVAKARYHDKCQHKLYNAANVNPCREATATEKAAHFIAKYIIDHKDDSQFSIKSILEQFDGDKSVDIKYLKGHLYSAFGNDIIIHPSKDGHIITYADACAKILTENWYKKKRGISEQEERDKVCSSAGKILFEDIRSKVYNTDSYPAPSNLVDNVKDDIPRSMRLILDEAILKNKNKPADWENVLLTISHIIIAAARPRSFLSPILIGFAAKLHKLYGSKELIQTLQAAGLCASYDEVRLFEASLLLHFGSEEKREIYRNGYIQMVLDNADRNVRTVDGHNTSHVEGGIEILTPGDVVDAAESVPRLKKLPPANVLGQFGKTNLQHIDKALAKKRLKNVAILDSDDGIDNTLESSDSSDSNNYPHGAKRAKIA